MKTSEELFSSKENPAPEGRHVALVKTADGAILRAAWWPSIKTLCAGTVCILHGRAEFIEKHFEIIGDLLQRGFAVVTFDWRGQGYSSREVKNPKKGHINDFSTYHLDVAAIQETIIAPLLPKPYFGIAYSMGGAIALDMAARQQLPFEKIVVVSPMLKVFFIKTPLLAKGLANLLCFFGLSKAFVPFGRGISISTRPFPGNRLSSDPIRYARMSLTAHALGDAAIGDPTIGWIKAAFRVMDRLGKKDVLQNIQTPLLLIAGGNDRICDSSTMLATASQIKESIVTYIPESRHETLLENDYIRSQFWTSFDAFISGNGAHHETVDISRDV